MSTPKSEPAGSDREIVISRDFAAPRDLVWRAWTDPKQVVRWWGPRGFTTTIETMDVRPGGIWKQVLHGPDGAHYPNSSIFTEVVEFERIVFRHGGAREGGPSAHFISTWTFEAVEVARTRVTIRMAFETAAARDQNVRDFGSIEGGKQALGRLAEHLEEAQPLEREIVLTRVFHAPRELVFRMWTEAELLRLWWGPKEFTNPVCEVDLKPGGSYRIVMRAPDGSQFPCAGVYREISRPGRLVFTNNAIGEDGALLLEGLTTVVFEEHAGRTTLTLRTRAKAVVDFARAFLTGMEAGWSQSLDKLIEAVEQSVEG
jgi:uncharacterized protein YndB with AHSA1/START domain